MREMAVISGIIDFHAHLGKVMYDYPPLTVEKLLRFMDGHGIEKSVVLPLVNPEEEDYPYSTAEALADCLRYPDRLIPFANVDPRRGSNDGNYDFYPVLKHYADEGCMGFGEILANLATNDPRMKGIYRACGELSFPVVFDFRLGTVGVIDPVGMPYLEECLGEFPQTVFVGHGPGWWAEISADVTAEQKAGYPHGPVVPGGSISRLLSEYPNMYADLSAGSGSNAFSRDPGYARNFVLRHREKLMFGTDRFVREEEPVMIDLLLQMDLPEDVQTVVFRDNAERLLNM
jgi:uncharacterized protein